MRTGIHLGIPGGGGVFSPLSLPGCEFWIRGDMGVTVATGISAWANQGSMGGSVDQAVAANQPALTASAIGGQPGATYDNVNDDLTWGGAAGDFTWLHNGSGSTVAMVWHPLVSGELLDTGGSLNAGQVGWGYEWFGTQRTAFRVADGGGVYVVNSTGALGTWNTGVPGYSVIRLQTGHAQEFDVREFGVSRASGALVGACSAAAPTGALKVGNRVGAAGIFDGHICEAIAYSRYLTLPEVLVLEAYLKGRYGL